MLHDTAHPACTPSSVSLQQLLLGPNAQPITGLLDMTCFSHCPMQCVIDMLQWFAWFFFQETRG
jgi:hypothetical protein